MKIRFLGQNSFLISYQGKNLLIDPFYNHHKEESSFDIEAQKIDYILLTNAHEDHTADVRDVFKTHSEVQLIAQPEICTYFKHSFSTPLNLGGSFEIEGLKITMLPAQHTSSFFDGSYGGTPVGYMFSFEGKNLYLSGDTGVMNDMAWFPEFFGNIDLAILPVGGFYTMDAKMASFAAQQMLKTSKVIGCHFDTFPQITINHEDAYQSFKERGIELILPKLGETYEL